MTDWLFTFNLMRISAIYMRGLQDMVTEIQPCINFISDLTSPSLPLFFAGKYGGRNALQIMGCNFMWHFDPSVHDFNPSHPFS